MCKYGEKETKTQRIHDLDGIQIKNHTGCVNVFQRCYLLLLLLWCRRALKFNSDSKFCHCNITSIKSSYWHKHVAIYSCCHYSQYSLNGRNAQMNLQHDNIIKLVSINQSDQPQMKTDLKSVNSYFFSCSDIACYSGPKLFQTHKCYF